MTKVTSNDSGASRSPWMEVPVDAFEPSLLADASTDVCVIGGGIAGLSTAYELLARGLQVIVVDDGPVGGGETARTTAHLASALDDRFVALESLHGREGARLAAESHQRAIDRIEQIAEIERIACGFRRVDGYLFAGGPEPKPESLTEEAEAAARAGLTGVERVEDAAFLGFRTGPAIRFPRQAQFHPLSYLAGLAKAVVRRGGRIINGVHVARIDEEGDSAVAVTADGKKVTARAVVSATNAPLAGGNEMSLKQAPYRSYAIGLRIPRGGAEPVLLWDDLDPYHYVRLADTVGEDGYDLLVVGGEDHRTGVENDAAERYDALERWARDRFPAVEVVVARWSGQVLEPIDGLAFIGRAKDRKHTYLITGDSGHGITHGVLGGILVADLIANLPNPWASPYDPRRRTIRAAKEFFRENATTMAQYADWLEGGDVEQAERIVPGTGAVVRRGLHLIAVYRDREGVCHERSAVCPHLGGIVGWNVGEASWDCPCHGSRFDPFGRVVMGPATSDLGETKPAAADAPPEVASDKPTGG